MAFAPSPPKKFVYTSSTSVYGQTDGSLVKETSPTEPLAETAKVLVETERLLLAAVAERKFPAVILRVAGIYGPERGHWFKQFLKNEARIEGDGSRFLNMIHRDDVTGCIIAALKNGRPGEIYNAVDDEPVSQVNFFQWLAEELGKDLPPSVPENLDENRKRGVTNKRVSNRKLKMELGYQFKYPNFRKGYSAEILRLERAGELRVTTGQIIDLIIPFPSGLLDRRLDPLRRHRQLTQPRAGGVVDGIGDDRAHHDDGRLAAALRRMVSGVEDHRLDLRHPGEAGDFVGVIVRVQDLPAFEMDFLGEGIAHAHGDAAFHLDFRAFGVDDQRPCPGRKRRA